MKRLLIVAALLNLTTLAAFSSSSDVWPPPSLRETGLYSDWNAKTVAPGKLRFSPQYPLWTDGAIKTRWMELPAGTFVDASDPDVWQFPVGTRFWKEFKFSRRAETRFIEHTAEGWKYAAYAWNDDESEALLVPERGLFGGVVMRGGLRHDIPSRSDCKSCHEGSPSRILGFSALQLSADRDPNAPHAEQISNDGITLRTLMASGLVRGLPAYLADGAPRIEANSPTERAALGYLNGTCAPCPTLSGELASLKFSLQYPLAAPPSAHAPGFVTTFGQLSKFVPPSWDAPGDRMVAGEPDRSVLALRMASRNPVAAMPPLGSRIVDDEAVALIRRWIAEEISTDVSKHKSVEDR